MYIPDVIPDDDRKAALKFQGGKVRRVGFGAKPAVIVVDMNYSSVDDRQPMGWSKTGVPAAKAIGKLLSVARRHRVPVIHTTGTMVTTMDNPAIMGIDKSGTVELSDELLRQANEFYPEVTPEKGEVVIRKPKPSAFFGTSLVSMLHFLDLDTLIVTGMTTAGCVRATVVDGFSYDYKVIVPLECVADRSTISHQVELFDMDYRYCDVMRLDEVIQAIENIAARK